MLVSQFHSKRWTTSIEGKPILCYFHPEIRPADPFGIRTRDSPEDFLFGKSLSLSFRVRLFSFLFLKKITENQMCLQSLMFQKKWLIRSFFVLIRPRFEPAPFSSLFVAVKETRAYGPCYYRWESQSYALLCRMDMLLFFCRELFQYSAFNWKTFISLSSARCG